MTDGSVLLDYFVESSLLSTVKKVYHNEKRYLLFLLVAFFTKLLDTLVAFLNEGMF